MSPWEISVQQFVDDCVEGRLHDPHAALKAFAELRLIAPAKYAALFDQPVTEERLAELCNARAFVCAAMELVGPYCGILVTRAASGPSSALVSFSGENRRRQLLRRRSGNRARRSLRARTSPSGRRVDREDPA